MARIHPRKPLGYWLRLSAVALIALAVALGLGFIKLNLDAQLRPARRAICCKTPADLGFEYQDVRFRSSDGIELAGWWIPSQNGAAVILLHGNGGDRTGMLSRAEFLAQAGFGVLLYDQRACGESQGELRSYGWLDAPDLLAAVEFVQGLPGVDAQRVGVLGVSLGAQIAIRAAAQTPGIQAVVADGTAIAVATDVPPARSLKEVFYRIPGYLMDWGQSLKTGIAPPEGVVPSISKIAPRSVLLIATGNAAPIPDWELYMGQYLYAAAGEPKELWEIPEARHTAGLAFRPEEYRQRVLEFFRKSLLD